MVPAGLFVHVGVPLAPYSSICCALVHTVAIWGRLAELGSCCSVAYRETVYGKLAVLNVSHESVLYVVVLKLVESFSVTFVSIEPAGFELPGYVAVPVPTFAATVYERLDGGCVAPGAGVGYPNANPYWKFTDFVPLYVAVDGVAGSLVPINANK